MKEFIDLLALKLDSKDSSVIEKYNNQLKEDYEITLTAREEVGYFLQLANDGLYPKDKIYEFLYKFVDFYYEDAEYLFDYANIIMFAVSEEWIDPIIGSRLMGSIWAVLGYPPELTEFIGTEGEIEYHDNRLRNEEIDDAERREIEQKLNQIRIQLIELSQEFIQNNTF
ncbi:MAG: hypothetical protein RIF34_10310 [Candidatus Kapaibacterium sp.]